MRKVIEKLDNQTERFNIILEDAVESVKTYEKEQKDFRDSLATGDSISKMTGIQTHAKEHTLKFGESILIYF